MPIYESKGTLTDTISSDNVGLAQEYLTSDDMTQYLDPPLRDAVERIRWELNANGHDYVVEAVAKRELTEQELKQLASWVSGQNSDGLGEGFEQQDFAWIDSGGAGWNSSDEDYEENDGHMCSFDWETNDSSFTRV